MQEITREVLIDALHHRNPKSFEILFKTYFLYAYKIAMVYLQNEEDAKDAVQTVMSKLWLTGNLWKTENPFKAYLRSITVNTSIDIIRKSKSSQTTDLQILEETSDRSAANVNDIMASKEMMKYIENLDFPAREVVKLFILEGYSHAEIAELIGISEKYSRVVLSLTRKRLNEFFFNQNNYKVTQNGI